MAQFLWLIPAGFVIGAYGTMIGAGGGFVLVPLLLLLYPQESPELITSISLAVVFFNALSGTIAYARMKRIDYQAGLLFSAATIPGAILGALSTAYIPRRIFDAVFGVVLVAVSLFLLWRPGVGREGETGGQNSYSYSRGLGVGLSLAIGYLSSVLGIGGGIIHVPVLVHLLNFPVHIATATSHFILAVMALAGTIVHISTGTFAHGVRRMLFLSLGVLPGAQLGAWLSRLVHGDWIIRALAVALGFVGVRIFILAW